ncbi:FAD-binding protein [Vibrio cyclitrophicus 1F53]|uniref:FAD-binding oxidoreductase n=2 Tax=Vibrionaceae TaxID=641 RepID=UPI000301AAEB|nr:MULTISPECIES: FAD-binding oxidoreductase [Vibrio]MBE8606819.1 FAD-binding oxidoreductase [Vibrio sp. OPT10]OEE85561.1 FAD-linked oxidase [Vibrio cyclitrophicus FF160]OEF32136.1 FAD-linked oxidase [Vibrio cyclitrophicus 1F53]OEF64801.1 FAD-linked oxidase [Vibrio cyclitrophicus 1F175]PMH25702.1 FAD-linked oxidase [Vibrio cyclitrophicus]
MTKISSWGRYPKHLQTAHFVNWPEQVAPLTTKLPNGFLPFGNGRSYGDSCLASNDHVLSTRLMNRFISADWQTGVLRAEAGVLLSEVLEQSVNRGWFLASTPGTKLITLGGAVANDVHGKNHHVAGTFGRHVRKFSLYRSDVGIVECSKDENSELFHATIAGLGLTGIILWVELQLKPIQSSLIDSQNIKFANLDEFFTLSREIDKDFDYTVAWIDCVSTGKNLGRGIYMVGNHASVGSLELPKSPKLIIPVDVPFSMVNRLTLKAFNTLYYNKQLSRKVEKKVSYEPFFYPLDAILEWNRIYGRSGFQQYQCVIPEDNAQFAMKEILTSISNRRMGSFLAVLKRCSDITSPGLLSFPMQGATLALDFPQVDGTINGLFDELDKIVMQAGGRLYPAKDAHMSSHFFQQAYPQWEELEKLRDPQIMSRFWQRVTR